MKSIFPILGLMLIQTVSQAQDKTITIHQNGGATVLDEQSINLVKGSNTFPITNFVDGYNPESIFLYSEGTPIQALLQRAGGFNELLKSYKGESITLQVEEGERITGILKDIKFGGLFLELKDNSTFFVSLGMIKSYQLPAKKVDFIQDDTVFGTMNSDKKQSKNVTVWYESGVFKWAPSYKLIFNESMTEASFQGLAKIDYSGDKDIEAAKVRLNFGNLNTYRNPRNSPQYRRAEMMSAKASAVYEDINVTEAESVGDAYEINLDNKVVFKPNQQLQLVLTDVKKIPIKKWYEYTSYGNAVERTKPDVNIEFKADKKNGFKDPIASGKLDVMLLKNKELRSLANQTIGNYGIDEKVKLTIGKALDILINEKVTEQDQITQKVNTKSVKMELVNSKKETVKVKVNCYLNPYTKITSSSIKYEMESQTAVFWVEIQAGKTVSLEYSTQTEYL